jgi:hypothetical protein
MKIGDLRLEDCINETCPWSGKRVRADSLTLYQGHVVGFCNPGCRDKFEQAITQFEKALAGASPRQRRSRSDEPASRHPPWNAHLAFAMVQGGG